MSENISKGLTRHKGAARHAARRACPPAWPKFLRLNRKAAGTTTTTTERMSRRKREAKY